MADLFNLEDRGDEHLRRLDRWFGRQQFDRILCTGGNHDFVLEDALRRDDQPFEHAVYLQDQRYEYEGIVFYGAPWTPKLSSHAFFGDDPFLQQKWSLIPDDTNVLITHTPPLSRLDVSSRGRVLGCEHLAGATRKSRTRDPLLRACSS